AEKNKIMHIALPIGKGNVLMATDVTGPMIKDFHEGNNISLSLHTDTKEEADRLFKGLAAGGKVNMPLEMQFWGAYWGFLTDKFGIQWMMSFDEKFVNSPH
ncbi:MAG: VOC family protein, partial [Flavitalea sp.]